LASKLTLERLRKEPQFIDCVFAAKTLRTRQEEEPVENVPETEVKNDFIIPQEEKVEVETEDAVAAVKRSEVEAEDGKDSRTE
jgi:ribonuclease-3